jgi:hypothetical protein
MTHLSAEELKGWYEQGSGDRARIIGHLAQCDVCRKSLSTMAATAEPLESAAPVVSVAEALPRGYAALESASPVRTTGWLRPVYGLAAAAVIVIAAAWLLLPSKVTNDNLAVRGSELVGLSPTGAGDASEFRFASPFQASRYRVTLRDSGGGIVFSSEGGDARITVDRSLRDRLTAGQSYSWVITALDAAGETIAASKPVTFRFEK